MKSSPKRGTFSCQGHWATGVLEGCRYGFGEVCGLAADPWAFSRLTRLGGHGIWTFRPW